MNPQAPVHGHPGIPTCIASPDYLTPQAATTGRTGSFRWRVWALVLAVFVVWPSAFAGDNAGPPPNPLSVADASSESIGRSSQAAGVSKLERSRRANLGQEHASKETINVANWVVDSEDNHDMPFMIVDKVNARVLMFDAVGALIGASPALLGLAIGDDSTPGIGDRKLSTIRPDERTTPAGRFVASLERDLHGEEILWIDYSTAISLHRVVKGTPAERRAQRMSSANAADKRISYGCINVPVVFYEKVVSPAFTGTNGIVYILPETRLAHTVFGSYDVDNARETNSAAPLAVVRGLQVSTPQ